MPVIRLMVVCRDLVLGMAGPVANPTDLADARWSIDEPLTDVFIPEGMEGEFGVQEIHVIAIISGGVGEFDIQVQIFHQELDQDSNSEEQSEFLQERSVFRSRTVRLTFDAKNRNNSHILPFHMTNVPFPDPGQYEFRLMANRARCVADAPTVLRVYALGEVTE